MPCSVGPPVSAGYSRRPAVRVWEDIEMSSGEQDSGGLLWQIRAGHLRAVQTAGDPAKIKAREGHQAEGGSVRVRDGRRGWTVAASATNAECRRSYHTFVRIDESASGHIWTCLPIHNAAPHLPRPSSSLYLAPTHVIRQKERLAS